MQLTDKGSVFHTPFLPPPKKKNTTTKIGTITSSFTCYLNDDRMCVIRFSFIELLFFSSNRVIQFTFIIYVRLVELFEYINCLHFGQERSKFDVSKYNRNQLLRS